MRCILVILDGLGDRAHDALGGRTPLQAAYTPNLDWLATAGMNGLYHACMQGVALSSEVAHALMFGYDRGELPGRGYLEAVGYGLEPGADDVFLLCHLCSVEERDGRLILVRERPGVDVSEMEALTEALSTCEGGDTGTRFVSTRKGDGLLVLSGAVSPAITDSDPIYEGRPLISVEPTDASPEARSTAEELNRYLRRAYRTLSGLPLNTGRREKGLPPLNALATQRAGKKKQLTPFYEKWGLRALSTASLPVYHGLCRELGMEIRVANDSDDPGGDLRERLFLAREAADFDFIHVHTKVADEAGHTKDPYTKKAVIEAIDRAMEFAVTEIMPDPGVLFVITADHSTASTGTMIHTGETVPLAMVGKYPRRDGVTAFNEVDCAGGALGPVRGSELMYLVLNFLDRGKLGGLMDTPHDQPYYPGHYRPLTADGD